MIRQRRGKRRLQDVLEQSRARVDEITDPVIHADAVQFDDMIRRVESGEFL